MSFFLNVYTTSLLKLSLCLPLRYLWANDFKGNGISGRDHYILFKSDGRHRMHCLVFTDTDLYSRTKGKAYLANQRWRRSTCLRGQCYDVGCHACIYIALTIRESRPQFENHAMNTSLLLK